MTPAESLRRFYEFLERPLFLPARVLLAVLTVFLIGAFTQPLWRISMEAPQYPAGLYMDIWAYRLEGGNDGQHIAEINTLNHYIGMRPIDDVASADLSWIPFALGALALLALRTAAIGNVRSLLDVTVLTLYVTLFAFGRFIYQLWIFGHELSPQAPVKIAPFMPVVLGSKQVANFTTHSFPQGGSYLLGTFVVGLLAIVAWHLVAGRRAAVRAVRSVQQQLTTG